MAEGPADCDLVSSHSDVAGRDRGSLSSMATAEEGFQLLSLSLLFIYLFLSFLSFRAAPEAYGGSWARGSNRSYSRLPMP